MSSLEIFFEVISKNRAADRNDGAEEEIATDERGPAEMIVWIEAHKQITRPSSRGTVT